MQMEPKNAARQENRLQDVKQVAAPDLFFDRVAECAEINEENDSKQYQEQAEKDDLKQQQETVDLQHVSIRKREFKKLQDAFVYLLGFGLSFALRIYILGFWLGGWIDKKWGGGRGYITLLLVVCSIIYAFVMLYRDLTRQEKRKKQKKKE